MGATDPYKRKKTIRFLIITAIIAISVGVGSSIIQGQLTQNDPLKVCINDRDTPYKIKATLELIIDGQKADIPANIGLNDGECQRTMYTLTNDGTIYAEWEEEYPFEIRPKTDKVVVRITGPNDLFVEDYIPFKGESEWLEIDSDEITYFLADHQDQLDTIEISYD